MTTAAIISQTPHVDVRLLGVVTNNSTSAVALANATKLNAAIVSYSGTGAVLLLPLGSIYVDKAGTNWSVRIGPTVTNVHIKGCGFGSRLIQNGVGNGSDWSLLRVEGSNCTVSDLTLEQGTITCPSDGQHDHLLHIANYGSDPMRFVNVTNVKFGKCLGDGINILGDTTPVENIQISNIAMDLYGDVMLTWAPSTAYPLAAQVINGDTAYICTTAGTSASSGGPTGSGTGITDGTAVWRTQSGVTVRRGARSGIAFQRGYNNVRITDFMLRGAQNSLIDMEATAAGVMRGAFFQNGVCDNSLGHTSTAVTFSGSSGGSDDADYCGMDNVLITHGYFGIIRTKNSRVSNVTVMIEAATAVDATNPLVTIYGHNESLQVSNLRAYRTGSSGVGYALSIQGTGDTTLDNITCVQDNAADAVYVEGLSDVSINGLRLNATSASMTTKSGVLVQAINASADRFRLTNANIASSGSTMKAGVTFESRSTYSIDRIMLSGVRCTGTATLANFNKAATSYMDPNPMLVGCDPGTGTLYTSTNDSDVPITTIYPMVGGTRKYGAQLVGTVAPDGAVAASAGSTYTNLAVDPVLTYFKAKGTNAYGWSAITMGTPSPTVYSTPFTAGDWTTFKAANPSISSLPTPTRSWSGGAGSGNLAAQIGSLALVASGSVTYGNAVAGYPITAVGIPASGASTGFSTTDASLGSPATVSSLMIVISKLGTLVNNRGILHLSDQNQVRTATAASRYRSLLAGTDGNSSVNLDTNVKIRFARVDETANTVLLGDEDQVFEPAYVSASSTTRRLGVGGFDATSQEQQVLAIWHWEGADAETMTKSNVKLLLQALGATVAW